MDKYWIVTLGETYKIATSEGFLWSPTLTKASKKNAGYENMKRAQPGDYIFTCVDQRIKDIGVVIQDYKLQTPPSDPAFKKWESCEAGYMLRVDWYHPQKGIFLKKYINAINSINSLPSPFTKNKLDAIHLKQQYLIEISEEYADLFFNKLSVENGIADIKKQLNKILELEANQIARDEDFGNEFFPTDKDALVKVRTAQLKFIENLSKVERGCRITNIVYDPGKIRDNYLIASHILPWSKCTNEQRIDGNNGLFLAPHIDYLFDRYLISFEKNGTMIISDVIKKDNILEKWCISNKSVGSFSDEQEVYLQYHREQFSNKQKENS